MLGWAATLTLDAVLGFELCGKLSDRSEPSILGVFEAQTDSLFGVGLIQDIKLEIGKSRSFVYQTDAGLTGIDLDAPVYPLQGSYTSYLCKTITTQTPAGKNCVKSVVPEASGWCYRNSFGDWKCRMQGAPPKMEAAGSPTAF